MNFSQTIERVRVRVGIDAGNAPKTLTMCLTILGISNKGYNTSSSSSSWCRATSRDIPDPFSPLLSFITSSRSSGLHPVSSHSCCMYVQAGRPALARPYVGVHRSASLMSSSLLPQQCPACLVRLTWIDFVMGGRCRIVGDFGGVAAI